jgi:hypothetical protein
MKQVTQKKHITNTFKFKDYETFSDLSSDTIIFSELVNAYQSIFAEPGAWEENYSHDEIIDNIEQAMKGYACLRVCIDPQYHYVIGFCWGQVASLSEVMTAIDTVEHYHRAGRPDLKTPLSKIIEGGNIMYIHELGIIPKYRQQISLIDLIYPVIINIALRSKETKMLFWSSPETCIHHVAKKAGIPMILANSKMQFFLGDLTDRLTNITT